MTTLPPPRLFADLETGQFEIEVACQRCGHVAVGDDTAPRLRHQGLAGRHYRCTQCGAIVPPSLCTLGSPSTPASAYLLAPLSEGRVLAAISLGGPLIAPALGLVALWIVRGSK